MVAQYLDRARGFVTDNKDTGSLCRPFVTTKTLVAQYLDRARAQYLDRARAFVTDNKDTGSSVFR